MAGRSNVTAGMAMSLRMWRYFAPRLLRIRDFSGGLNLREAPPELAANESPDLWNVTLDERGGVAKRLGYTKVNGTPFSGGLVQNLHYSGVLSELRDAGRGVALPRDGTNTARQTFSTRRGAASPTSTARCGRSTPPTASTRRPATGSPGRGRGSPKGTSHRLLAEPADHERLREHDAGQRVGDRRRHRLGDRRRARLEQRAPREPERRLRRPLPRVGIGVDIAAGRA
jgi:hypothetical protein